MRSKKLTLKRGDYLLIRGPALVNINSGLCDAFGSTLSQGSRVTIVSGRQIPLRALEESTLEINIGVGGGYKDIHEDPIPEEWNTLYNKLKKEEGFRAIILGDVDTGKSSLILYLSNMLVKDGFRVGIVDADIGQSDIGPPGTIGLSIVDRESPSFSELKLFDAYFIGDKTPVGHLLPMVLGIKKMVDKAFEYNIKGVLVNTTGFIYGGVARALKKYKIEAVNPTHIIGLSIGNELKPLIKSLGIENETIFLKSPKYIARKEFRHRKIFRHLKMGVFFENYKDHVVSLKEVKLENTVLQGRTTLNMISQMIFKEIGIKPISMFLDREDMYLFFKRKLSKSRYMKIYNRLKSEYSNVRIISLETFRGLYIGLFKRDKFVGVGRLEDIDLENEKIVFKAPENIGEIDKIVFGYIILDENFNEKASIKPGYLG